MSEPSARAPLLPLARHYGAVVHFLGYDPATSGDTPGERLRALRRRLELTHRELATRLGLNERTVTELELGRRRASRKVSAAIAELMAERVES